MICEDTNYCCVNLTMVAVGQKTRRRLTRWFMGLYKKEGTPTKAEDTTKDIPVILFSTRNDIENTYRRMNARDFIRKPFDIKIFREKVRKQMD